MRQTRLAQCRDGEGSWGDRQGRGVTHTTVHAIRECNVKTASLDLPLGTDFEACLHDEAKFISKISNCASIDSSAAGLIKEAVATLAELWDQQTVHQFIRMVIYAGSRVCCDHP